MKNNSSPNSKGQGLSDVPLEWFIGMCVKMEGICDLQRYKTLAGARKAVALLKKHGVRAVTNPRELGECGAYLRYSGKDFPVWVKLKDSRKADKILEGWSRKRGDMRSLTVYPEDATLDLLDMLIHDCRQYLMIATGEIKSIEEEGVLELDDPSGDIDIITLRLKRLKDQCMRMAGRRPLDWIRDLPK
jgi:hypothetical protein